MGDQEVEAAARVGLARSPKTGRPALKVVLTAAELAQAAAVGTDRMRNARAQKAADHIVQAERPAEIDRLGAAGELAFHLATGLPWHRTLYTAAEFRLAKAARGDAGLDVGGFEVRATHHAGGCLLLHPKDPKDRPFALVIAQGDAYYVVGWGYPDELLAGRRLEDRARYGRPCYYVEQASLRPAAALDTPVVRAVFARYGAPHQPDVARRGT